MPVAPRKICLKPGCNELVQNGSYCGHHTVQRQTFKKEAEKKYDNERGTAHKRGYTSRWTRYSISFRKANPLCAECERQGVLKLGDHVDHIIPVKDANDPLFWEISNHQTLCKSCHSIKTAKEDGGFGNEKKPVLRSL